MPSNPLTHPPTTRPQETGDRDGSKSRVCPGTHSGKTIPPRPFEHARLPTPPIETDLRPGGPRRRTAGNRDTLPESDRAQARRPPRSPRRAIRTDPKFSGCAADTPGKTDWNEAGGTRLDGDDEPRERSSRDASSHPTTHNHSPTLATRSGNELTTSPARSRPRAPRPPAPSPTEPVEPTPRYRHQHTQRSTTTAVTTEPSPDPRSTNTSSTPRPAASTITRARTARRRCQARP